MLEENESFEEPLEWRLVGNSESVRRLLRTLADEFAVSIHKFSGQESRLGSSVLTLVINATSGPNVNAVGCIQVLDLPQGSALLRVPPRRGIRMLRLRTWLTDFDGHLFGAFLEHALSELKRHGFLAASSRFDAHRVLETARRELDGAQDPAAHAAVGNILRSALIALADELYKPHMAAGGDAPPKGDDASAKLKLAASHYFAGKSERFKQGLKKTIEGSWDMASAFLHRKSATREEAEACLALVAGVFDAMSFIVPR